MHEWNTSEAPAGREIEFEIDGRELQRGRLSYAGSGGVGKPGMISSRMKTLYMAEDDSSRIFSVTRWREIE